MFSKELIQFLQELLQAHDVDTSRQDQWLLPNGRLPAMRGTWHPHTSRQSGRLDIQIALEDGRTIEESFAGLGEGLDGCRDALRNFTLGSLHVILAALWDRVDEEQITVEDWLFSSRHRKAFIGNFVPRSSGGKPVDIPPETFEAIEAAIRNEDLGSGLHWVRTFFCNVGSGEKIVEALLDNERWEAGAVALTEVGWKASEQFYSVRNFLILDDPR